MRKGVVASLHTAFPKRTVAGEKVARWFENPSHRITSFVDSSVVFLNYFRTIWPWVSSWNVTFAQLCRDGEPSESKQDVNAKKYIIMKIAYKFSVDLFLKDNNRQDFSRYWWEGLS